jgi:DNA-binding beta-propeller fold protein YncE
LRELESKYSRELAVIGVHSGKYHAERVTARIRDASLRLDAIHPVVNDRQFRTWRSYAVSAWPTLVAIDPAGYVVGAHAGEFAAEMLFPFIDGLIENARSRGTLNDIPVELRRDEPTNTAGRLRYPGKVLVAGERIAIADSGGHRILIGMLEQPTLAKIDRVVGTGTAGFNDGKDGSFNFPQGMAVDGDKLYVADAGNHSIREVNLSSGELRTIAGTGSQLRTREDRAKGAMSSPWDVSLSGKTLFVAMAGTHQIWSVDLRNGASRVHAGMGGEDIRDGDNQNALLAQPMGITLYRNQLYFADSESNAIRSSETADLGTTGTIVGTGLFDFGDVDGRGDDVRLQHPQGIAPHPGGGLLVADSYNDSIKKVDPDSRQAEAWVRGLNEPSGISCSDTHAYVADTNAHRVMVIDLSTQEMNELRLE